MPLVSVKEPVRPVPSPTQYEERLPEDHVLLGWFQAGDQNAFSGLYRRYHRRVLSYVISQVRDRHLAEDLTADTFARALTALPKLTNLGRPLDAWLITIARRLLVDHYRRLQLNPITPVACLDLGIADTWNPEAAPEATVISQARVRAAVAALEPEMREVVVRRILLDHSIKQTATDLGLHASKVKHHLRRARLLLWASLTAEVIA